MEVDDISRRTRTLNNELMRILIKKENVNEKDYPTSECFCEIQMYFVHI